MTPPPPSLGPYEVEELLARGNVSEVYKARRRSGSGRVAVKVLLPGLSPRVRERFLEEATLARELDHPAIVRAIDIDLGGPRPWIAMELVEGWNLEVLLETARPRLLRILPRICRSLLEALVALGEAGLIHRDVTPRNVLVSPRDEVKLIDMGLLGRPAAGLAGTPAYLAPEALRNERLGAQSDLYQVGAVIYEILSEFLPHEDLGANFLELRRDAGCPPTPLGAVAPGTSSKVATLIAEMLHPRPEERPTAAEALARAREIPAPWFHQAPVAQLFDHRDRGQNRDRLARIRRRQAALPPGPEKRPVMPALEQLYRLAIVLILGLVIGYLLGVY